ncbi:hypothetical protein OG782_00950 [Streptomyces sp. NBC_00876]|uniref:hypothetical protein n=1 Tax=Streptomyces sp. NBC_00876 TaxID=2975853 RepID=UPI00386723A7|nr:hypothetical protein OG782_00950 [Streptomyces sp. NBC_00876]
MICPHCERNLLRKERPRNTCSHCGREYALDPKTNPLGLSDLRVRRVLAKITEEGRIAVAPDQLWFALARTRIKERKFAPGCAGSSLFAGLVVGFFGLSTHIGALLVISAVLLLTSVAFACARAAGAGRGIPAMSRAAFRSQVLGPWRTVYGALPLEVIEDSAPPRVRTGSRPSSEDGAGAGAVLLCPDSSIRAFLTANGLPARYGITLAEHLDAVHALPARGPVIVLRDADAHGELLIRQVRETLGQRPVIDAGVPLRAARALARPVPYRDRADRPGRETMARLTALGEFTEEELKWLGRGWRVALVGIPPARLLATVGRVAERAARGTGPGQHRAAAVGFMTWPAPAHQNPEGDR